MSAAAPRHRSLADPLATRLLVAMEPFARTSSGAAALRAGIRYEGAVRQQQRRLAAVGAAVLGSRTQAQRWATSEHEARRQMAPNRASAGDRSPRVFWHGPDSVRGSGRPTVVLVNGWTASGLLWPSTMVERLGERAEVVCIDNRGSGWSRTSPAPFTIADLADDVVDVLDAIGAATATVVGLSMGGMIAQELAMRHPTRVDQLVLCATRPPAPAGFAPSPAAVSRVMSSPASGEHVRSFVARAWTGVTAPGFAERCPAVLDEMVDRVLARPTPHAAVLHQLRAISSWHGSSRLGSISAPTTVLHGSVDPLIPVGNGMRLAQLVPGARYVELAGVGHLVAHEAADDVVAAVWSAPGTW